MWYDGLVGGVMPRRLCAVLLLPRSRQRGFSPFPLCRWDREKRQGRYLDNAVDTGLFSQTVNKDEIDRIAGRIITGQAGKFPYAPTECIDPEKFYRLSIHALFGMDIKDFRKLTGLSRRYCFMIQSGSRGMTRPVAEHVSACTGINVGLILQLVKLCKWEYARWNDPSLGPSKIPDCYAHYFFLAPAHKTWALTPEQIQKAAEVNRARIRHSREMQKQHGALRAEDLARSVEELRMGPDILKSLPTRKQLSVAKRYEIARQKVIFSI